MRLLIVGSVAIDSVETPFGKVDNALGGSATYASIAASYFTSPGIVAVVGHDFEKRHINLLKNKGVDLKGLQIDPARKTFFWSGYYEGDMNMAHTRVTELNVFESFNPVIPESYRDAPFILLENIHPGLQLEVLSQVKKPRLVMCDTMNFWINNEPGLLEKVFKEVNVICINEDEARSFCNNPSLPAAANELLKLGPEYIIIKKGIHGVVLFGKESFFALPSMPLLKVKDPTGAGDSFAGGTIGYIARSGRINENIIRRGLVAGTVLASYCVEDFSCRRTVTLKPAEIAGRARLLREYSRIPAFRI
jgi:sugar/nucleoside kinase (ribokinase family)